MIAALTANHDLLPLVQGCCFQVKHSFYINRARHLLNPLVCPMYLSFLPSRNMDFYFEDRRTISNVAGTWNVGRDHSHNRYPCQEAYPSTL